MSKASMHVHFDCTQHPISDDEACELLLQVCKFAGKFDVRISTLDIKM